MSGSATRLEDGAILHGARAAPVAAPSPGWARRVAGNVVALAGARVVSALLGLVQAALLARALGPDGFGILGFGAALLGYFAIAGRPGLETHGTREIAGAPGRVRVVVDRILSLQVTLAGACAVVYAAVVLALGRDAAATAVLLVQGGALLAQAIAIEWVWQGLQRMGVLALRNVAMAAAQVVLVFVLVRRPDDLIHAAWVQSAAVAALNLWLLVSYGREFGRVRLRWEPRAWLAILRPAAPVALGSLMVGFYYSFDLLVLGLMRGDAEAGWYAAGLRAVTAAVMGAMVFGQAFFPALVEARGDAARELERSGALARALAPAGVCVAAVGAWFAGPALLLFAGAGYAPGTEAFRLLMINAGIAFATMALGQPLIAWGGQVAYARALGIGAALNVALNLALVRSFGGEGVAAATVAANGLAALVLARELRARLGTAHGGTFVRALAALVGCAPAWGLDRWSTLPWPALALAAVLGYGAMAAWLGLVPRFPGRRRR